MRGAENAVVPLASVAASDMDGSEADPKPAGCRIVFYAGHTWGRTARHRGAPPMGATSAAAGPAQIAHCAAGLSPRALSSHSLSCFPTRISHPSDGLRGDKAQRAGPASRGGGGGGPEHAR